LENKGVIGEGGEREEVSGEESKSEGAKGEGSEGAIGGEVRGEGASGEDATGDEAAGEGGRVCRRRAPEGGDGLRRTGSCGPSTGQGRVVIVRAAAPAARLARAESADRAGDPRLDRGVDRPAGEERALRYPATSRCSPPLLLLILLLLLQPG
jgi:hypothetical protein